MAQVAVLMPVGPGERDVERAADTIESVVAHEPAVEWFVLIDDAGHDRQLSRRLEAHGRSLSVLANPRRGRGHGLLGGLCVGVLAGLAWIRESTTADVALRLDTDALAIAPFADKLARAFEETPDVGVLGSYDRTCNGAVRDFAPWEGPMGMLARRVRLHRHPGRRPYLGLALAGHQAQIRRHVLTALGNGYRPGEHCLAGAMAVSRELIERMASHGYLDDPLCWRALPCGDDPMIAMYARAAGMRLRGLVAKESRSESSTRGCPTRRSGCWTGPTAWCTA